jgi:hypothetical protein
MPAKKKGNKKPVKSTGQVKKKAAAPTKQPFFQRPGGKLLAGLGEMGLRMADKHFLGGAAGKIFDTLTGHGDYQLSAGDLPYDLTANTVVHPSLTPTVPRMSDDRGATRIRHREYLTNVSTTSAFSLSPFRLQPGDAKTFPWMAPIARLYQQYKFLGVVFEFVTTSGTFSAPSPALGQVMMATQYNVTQPVFATQASMLNSYFSCSGVPATSLMHAVECENAESPYQLYFVRNPGVVPQDIKDPGGPSYEVRDPHLFDFGVFQFASSGGPVANDGFVCGQLWITYDVMLYKPVLPTVGFGMPPPPPVLISAQDRVAMGLPTQEHEEKEWRVKMLEYAKANPGFRSGAGTSDGSQEGGTELRSRECREKETGVSDLSRPVRAWF